jgi:putative endonuclease
LQRQGLRLVERNYRCKGGEIDLIMHTPAGELVFVEVRQRASRAFGGAAASVTGTKQRRLVLAAQHYLARLARVPACRFDVVAIDGGRLEWIENAFEA